MQISTETLAMIKEDLRTPGMTIPRLARHYKIPAVLLREQLEAAPPPQSNIEQHGGLGRPEMQKYIVARTPAGAPWSDDDYDVIERAREAYDAGTVELCQGRDGNWMILYSIPRKVPAKRQARYFVLVDGYFYDRG